MLLIDNMEPITYPICSTISLALVIMLAPVKHTMPAISILYQRALQIDTIYTLAYIIQCWASIILIHLNSNINQHRMSKILLTIFISSVPLLIGVL